MGRLSSSIAVAAICLLSIPAAAEGSAVDVQLELSQLFFYEGDPLNVRVSVRNGGETEIGNPVKGDLFSGFRAESSDGTALDRSKIKISSPVRPANLAPQSFYGGIVDAGSVFPDLHKPGSYRLYWSDKGLLSNRLEIRVIPRYDPEKRYRATLDTSMGPVEMDFFPERSPIAVKAFIDLAQSGYYDGLQFHENRADNFIVGGDPVMAGVQRAPFQFPAEISAIPMVSGTVLLKPAGAAPPTNSPQFIILLTPQPNWTGQVTVLGQVIKGLDIVQKISKSPNSGPGGRPPFRPTQAIELKSVKIREIENPANSAVSGD